MLVMRRSVHTLVLLMVDSKVALMAASKAGTLAGKMVVKLAVWKVA
jgi:hypothetical protein